MPSSTKRKFQRRYECLRCPANNTAPINRLPLECRQIIFTHVVPDATIAHDLTCPHPALLAFHRLRLVCWKWCYELPHVLEQWERRREALIKTPPGIRFPAGGSKRQTRWERLLRMTNGGEYERGKMGRHERKLVKAKEGKKRRERRRRAKLREIERKGRKRQRKLAKKRKARRRAEAAGWMEVDG